MSNNKFRKHVRTTTLTCIRMPSILMPVKKGNSEQPSQSPKNGQQRVYVATKNEEMEDRQKHELHGSCKRNNNKRGFNRSIKRKVK